MVWCCTFPVGCPHMEEPWPCAACLRAARALLRPEPRGFQIIVWYYIPNCLVSQGALALCCVPARDAYPAQS